MHKQRLRPVPTPLFSTLRTRLSGSTITEAEVDPAQSQASLGNGGRLCQTLSRLGKSPKFRNWRASWIIDALQGLMVNFDPKAGILDGVLIGAPGDFSYPRSLVFS